jgi:hypothetical protein
VAALALWGASLQAQAVSTTHDAAPTAPASKPSAAKAAVATYAVVTNSAVPVTDMTFDDLRNVFFFRKKFWSGGKRVVVLLPGTGLDARGYLLSGIYRMNDAGLKRLILEKLFQGELDMAPRVAESYEDAISFTAAARGALAIVRADLVPSGQSGVKVLRINGKMPGDPGYQLTQ